MYTVLSNKAAVNKENNEPHLILLNHEVSEKSYLIVRLAPTNLNTQPGVYEVNVRQRNASVEPFDTSLLPGTGPAGGIEVKRDTPVTITVWCRVLSLVMDSAESRNGSEKHYVKDKTKPIWFPFPAYAKAPNCGGKMIYKVFVDGVEKTDKWLGID